MADLGFSDEALETYEALERDQSRWPTLDVVEAAIEAIAAEPGGRDATRRRLQHPPCLAVPVPTPEGEWIVLWRPVAEHDAFSNLAVGDVYVLYLGALPG